MIVLDASAAIDALIGAAPTPDLLTLIAGDIAAPTHLGVEVLSVLRRLERAGLVSSDAALTAWEDFRDLSIDAYAFDLLAGRVWELRHQFTTYDAAYLALAEELGAPLVTADAKLVSSGHRAEVHLVTPHPGPERS